MDGAMTKAPLGGEKSGPNSTDRGKEGIVTDTPGIFAVARSTGPCYGRVHGVAKGVP